MFFDKFKSKKKEKSLPQKEEIAAVENNTFGKVRNFGNWYSLETHDFKLWGEVNKVRLWAVANDETEPITPKQEQACQHFFKNISEEQKTIEQTVSEFFHIDDTSVLKNSVFANGIYFSRDGKCGVDMSVELDEEYIASCGIAPDESFGIALFPEVKFFTSGEDFMDFYCGY